MVWGFSHKKQTSLTQRVLIPQFVCKSCSEGLFLWFYRKYMLYFIFWGMLFFKEFWYLFNSCYFRDVFFKSGVLISQFFVSLFPNQWEKWGTATYNIIPLTWKHSRFYLRTFLSLSRRDQGLIMLSLGCIRVMVFNPLNANPTKWSNTLKQFIDSSVFDNFVGLALEDYLRCKMMTYQNVSSEAQAKNFFYFFLNDVSFSG